MLFRVCEHYKDEEPIVLTSSYKYNECFICFEYKIDDKFSPITLKTQKIYFKNCNCDGAIHNKCLNIWIQSNKSCPICRINVIIKNNSSLIFSNFIPYSIFIYLSIKKFFLKFFKIMMSLLFLYYVFDLYFYINKTRYNHIYEYNYVPLNCLDCIDYFKKH